MPSKLQDEIKQTRPFARSSSEAFLSILRTATLLEHEGNEALRPHGLTHTQYNVLRILRGAGRDGLCGRAIAERLISKVPDVSRLLDRMDEMDLITRERDATDRRHVTARISARGRRLLVQAEPDIETLERKRFSGVPPTLVAALVKALAAVRGAAETA
jgi:DNA-binding MarR family transcriptional regulator